MLQSMVFALTNIMRCCTICSEHGSTMSKIFMEAPSTLHLLAYGALVVLFPMIQTSLLLLVIKTKCSLTVKILFDLDWLLLCLHRVISQKPANKLITDHSSIQ